MAGANELTVALRITGDASGLKGATDEATADLAKVRDEAARTETAFAPANGPGILNRQPLDRPSLPDGTDELAKLDRALDGVLSRLDPVYAATKRYTTAVDALNEGLERGLIGEPQWVSAMQGAQAELERAAPSGIAQGGAAADDARFAALARRAAERGARNNAGRPAEAAHPATGIGEEIAETALPSGVLATGVTHAELMPDAAKGAAAARGYGTELLQLDRQIGYVSAATSTWQLGQAKLNDLLAAGAITAAEHAERVAFLRAAYETGASAAEHLGHGTAGVTRELLVLGHEGVAGNFARIPGSLMVLGERFDAVGAAIRAVGVGGVAAGVLLVGALATVTAAALGGAEQIRRLDAAIKASGGAVGLRGSQVDQIATQAAAAGHQSSGTYHDVALAAIGSGQIDSAVLPQLLGVTADYAAGTGQDADKAGHELVADLANPTAAAARLTEQYHLLSAAELEHIERLQRQGDLEGAQMALLDGINRRFKGAADEGLSDFDRVLRKIGDKMRPIGDGMAALGKPTAVEQMIAAQRAKLAQTGTDNIAVGDDAALGDGGGPTLHDYQHLDQLVTWQAERDVEARLKEESAGRQTSINAGLDLSNTLDPDAANQKRLVDQSIAAQHALQAFKDEYPDLGPHNLGTDGIAYGLADQFARLARSAEAALLQVRNYRTQLQQLQQQHTDIEALAGVPAGQQRQLAETHQSALRQYQADPDGVADADQARDNAAAGMATAARDGAAETERGTQAMLRLAEATRGGAAAAREAALANQIEAETAKALPGLQRQIAGALIARDAAERKLGEAQAIAGAEEQQLAGAMALYGVTGQAADLERLVGLEQRRAEALAHSNQQLDATVARLGAVQSAAGDATGGVDRLVAAVIKVESRGNNSEVSHAHDGPYYGLMQVGHAAAADVGFGDADLTDPKTNVAAGTAYLQKMVRDQGSTPWGLAAYNAGPGPVGQWRQQGLTVDQIPWAETRDYVRQVTAAMGEQVGTADNLAGAQTRVATALTAHGAALSADAPLTEADRAANAALADVYRTAAGAAGATNQTLRDAELVMAAHKAATDGSRASFEGLLQAMRDGATLKATADLNSQIDALNRETSILQQQVAIRQQLGYGPEGDAAVKARGNAAAAQAAAAGSNDPQGLAAKWLAATNAADDYNKQLQDGEQEYKKHQDALNDIARLGESSFDRIGGAITQAFVQGQGGALGFKTVLKGVFSEIEQDVIKLGVINPIENWMLGSDAKKARPTLNDLVGADGAASSAGGSDGSVSSTSLFAALFGDSSSSSPGLLLAPQSDGTLLVSSGADAGAAANANTPGSGGTVDLSSLTKLLSGSDGSRLSDTLDDAWSGSWLQSLFGGGDAASVPLSSWGVDATPDWSTISVGSDQALATQGALDDVPATDGFGVGSGSAFAPGGLAAGSAFAPATDSGALATAAGSGGFMAGAGPYALGGMAASLLGNAIGGTGGAVLSGAGQGAGMGAALGSVIPGVGTAIGALGGALVGGITGLFGNSTPSVGPNGGTRVAFDGGTGQFVSGLSGGDNGFNPSQTTAEAKQLASALNQLVVGDNLSVDTTALTGMGQQADIQQGGTQGVSGAPAGQTADQVINNMLGAGVFSGSGAVGTSLDYLTGQAANDNPIGLQSLQTALNFAQALQTATDAADTFGSGLSGATDAAKNSADANTQTIKGQLSTAETSGVESQWQSTEQLSLKNQVTSLTDATPTTSLGKSLATLQGQIAGVADNAAAAGVTLDQGQINAQLTSWLQSQITQALGGTGAAASTGTAYVAENAANDSVLTAAGASTGASDQLLQNELTKLLAGMDPAVAAQFAQQQGGAVATAWGNMAQAPSGYTVRRTQATQSLTAVDQGSGSVAAVDQAQTVANLQRQVSQTQELNAATDDYTRSLIEQTQAEENAAATAQQAQQLQQIQNQQQVNTDNLSARAASASGDSADAQTIKLDVQHEQELDQARTDGMTDIDQLIAVQDSENAQLQAQIANQEAVNAINLTARQDATEGAAYQQKLAQTEAQFQQERYEAAQDGMTDMVALEQTEQDELNKIAQDAYLSLYDWMQDQLAGTETPANQLSLYQAQLANVYAGQFTGADQLSAIEQATSNVLSAAKTYFGTATTDYQNFATQVLEQVSAWAAQNGIPGFDAAVPAPEGTLAVPGFASGGTFTVGGWGGVDSTLVKFAATPGEQVTVTGSGLAGSGAAWSAGTAAPSSNDALIQEVRQLCALVQQLLATTALGLQAQLDSLANVNQTLRTRSDLRRAA